MEQASGNLDGFQSFLHQCGSKKNNLFILRKYKAGSTCRNINTELEHIGKLIGLIGCRRVAVSSHISHFGILQITFGMSRMSPLSDKSGIGRYNDLTLVPSAPESGGIVPVRSGSQKIQFIILFTFR